MSEFKDRVPMFPNRRLIMPENSGEPFYATIERADEPVEEGTPINRALLGLPLADAYTTTGSANAYIVTAPEITELRDGMRFYVRFHAANTSTTVTLNVNGYGTKPLYRSGTIGPFTGGIGKGSTWQLEYRGGAFMLIAANVPRGKSLVATFTASGTFTPADYGLEGALVDVYMVAGGANGGLGAVYYGGGGGGGGEATLIVNYLLSAASYNLTVGAAGGDTIGFGITLKGGQSERTGYYGGDGMSGGGSGGANTGADGGDGGWNGMHGLASGGVANTTNGGWGMLGATLRTATAGYQAYSFGIGVAGKRRDGTYASVPMVPINPYDGKPYGCGGGGAGGGTLGSGYKGGVGGGIIGNKGGDGGVPSDGTDGRGTAATGYGNGGGGRWGSNSYATRAAGTPGIIFIYA